MAKEQVRIAKWIRPARVGVRDADRVSKKVAYVLNRGARYGLFRKSADAKFSNGDSNARVGARGFYNENPNDSRLAPRPHMRRGSAFVGFAMRLSKQASEL